MFIKGLKLCWSSSQTTRMIQSSSPTKWLFVCCHFWIIRAMWKVPVCGKYQKKIQISSGDFSPNTSNGLILVSKHLIYFMCATFLFLCTINNIWAHLLSDISHCRAPSEYIYSKIQASLSHQGEKRGHLHPLSLFDVILLSMTILLDAL